MEGLRDISVNEVSSCGNYLLSCYHRSSDFVLSLHGGDLFHVLMRICFLFQISTWDGRTEGYLLAKSVLMVCKYLSYCYHRSSGCALSSETISFMFSRIFFLFEISTVDGRTEAYLLTKPIIVINTSYPATTGVVCCLKVVSISYNNAPLKVTPPWL